MKISPAIFEENEIRRTYDEKTETWFFAVVNIVKILTRQSDFQTARKSLPSQVVCGENTSDQVAVCCITRIRD